MKTTIEIKVLGFTGFYQGIWDQSENEWRETHEMKYGDYEDFESLHMIEDWDFLRIIMKRLANCSLKNMLI